MKNSEVPRKLEFELELKNAKLELQQTTIESWKDLSNSLKTCNELLRETLERKENEIIRLKSILNNTKNIRLERL
ncbi:hypothetical protein [Flavobacterium covae]|uniref:hypothetical protein n=1 Tax=Flavobacterium covae TaxID=2906076 RepID=UPI000745E298|nr:hypothetical protein [Flavobacterium covae]AMA50444.1 hypothetical protein AWN65_13735 [Flavobacterium covae]MCJ1809079.1 hypothetical protein [Flavobacterium covae]